MSPLYVTMDIQIPVFIFMFFLLTDITIHKTPIVLSDAYDFTILYTTYCLAEQVLTEFHHTRNRKACTVPGCAAFLWCAEDFCF